MTRFARAVMLPLVLLCALAGSAAAYPRLSDPIPISFRHFSTTGGGQSQFLSGTSYYADSGYAGWNSSNTQAALVSDTTAWFTLSRYSVPNFPVYADSVPLLTMILAPVPPVAFGGPTTAAADSFNFVLQGSHDGINVAMSAPAVDILELGTSNCFSRLWNSTRLGAVNGVTATNVNMYGFPFYRIIVKDFTGTTGQFQLFIRHWMDAP